MITKHKLMGSRSMIYTCSSGEIKIRRLMKSWDANYPSILTFLIGGVVTKTGEGPLIKEKDNLLLKIVQFRNPFSRRMVP